MLNRTIPQFEDEAADWQRFLYKACRGSCKAMEMLMSAEMAQLARVTGDASAPATWNAEAADRALETFFPRSPPEMTAQEIVDHGCRQNWFPHQFRVTLQPRNEIAKYQALWRNQEAADWTAAVNDALLCCLSNWSLNHYRQCCAEDPCDYNSQHVISGMLYLSLVWPSDA
jgi:hypothetical protein